MGSIREKLKSIVSWIISAIIIGAFFLFGLKGCVVTGWSPGDKTETYAIYGEDGRFMKLIFFPDHRTLTLYGNFNDNSLEAVLSKMYGTVATHYLWRLWNVSDDDSPFGIRIYPSGVEPVRMEIKIINKFKRGLGDSSFGKVGSKYDEVLLFKEEGIRYENMWLQKEETDEEFISSIMASFGSSTTSNKD